MKYPTLRIFPDIPRRRLRCDAAQAVVLRWPAFIAGREFLDGTVKINAVIERDKNASRLGDIARPTVRDRYFQSDIAVRALRRCKYSFRHVCDRRRLFPGFVDAKRTRGFTFLCENIERHASLSPFPRTGAGVLHNRDYSGKLRYSSPLT